MKKIFTILILIISANFTAQTIDEAGFKLNIDRNLYPVQDEDSYSSEDSLALLGISFMEGDFINSQSIINSIAEGMRLENVIKSGSVDENYLAISGSMNAEMDGIEQYIELYIVKSKDNYEIDGFIFIMSSYPVEQKDIYGEQGKKVLNDLIKSN